MQEFKRIFNIKTVIKIAVLIVVNCILFVYQTTAGRSYEQILFEKKQLENIYAVYASYDAGVVYKIMATADAVIKNNTRKDTESDEFVNNEAQKIIDEYEQLKDNEKEWYHDVISQVKGHMSYVRSYSTRVQKIVDNAEKMQNNPLYSDSTSYAYANIKKTHDDYQRMLNVEPEISNIKGVEAVVSYKYMNYIAFAIIVLIIYGFLAERENHMWPIISGSSKGRLWLVSMRMLIVVITSFFVTLTMHATVLITSMVIYGNVSFGIPVQTSELFSEFTYSIDVGEYFVTAFLLSWGVVLAMSLLIWLVFSFIRNRNIALTVIFALVCLEFGIYKVDKFDSIFLFFKKFNVINIFNINEIYLMYENVAVKTAAISESNLIIGVMSIIIAVCAILILIINTVKKPFSGRNIFYALYEMINKFYQKALFRFPVIIKEMHKLLFTARGIIIMAVCLVGVMYCLDNGVKEFTDDDKAKEMLYIEKGGSDYEDINKLVKQRKDNYIEAKEYLDYMQQRYDESDITFAELASVTGYYNQMAADYAAVREYEEKADYLNQLESRDINGYMVSDRSYEQIFGNSSYIRELFVYLIFLTSVIIIVSDNISIEARSGMNRIIKASYDGWHNLVVRKIITAVIMMVIMYLCVYGMDYIKLSSTYGYAYLEAPVQSLTFMENFGLNVSIGGWIIIRHIIKIFYTFICVIAAIIIDLCAEGSSKLRKPVLILIADIAAYFLIGGIVFIK